MLMSLEEYQEYKDIFSQEISYTKVEEFEFVEFQEETCFIETVENSQNKLSILLQKKIICLEAFFDWKESEYKIKKLLQKQNCEVKDSKNGFSEEEEEKKEMKEKKTL